MTTAISLVDAAWIDLKTAQAKNIEMLLPAHMRSKDGYLRFMNQVKMALYRIPKLAECSKNSLQESFLQCAELGLDPTFRLGSACIVPFKGVATLIIGYRGLIDLAVRGGEVRTVNAWIVHEKDLWKPRAGVMPTHVPYWPGPKDEQDPGAVTGAWARYSMRYGGQDAELMTKREIDAVMAKAPSVRMKQRTPWTDDPFSYEEMAKKTVIRRALKKAPLSPEKSQALGMALELESKQEEEVREVDAAEEAAAEPPKKSRAEEVRERIVGPMTDAEKEEIRRQEVAEPGSNG